MGANSVRDSTSAKKSRDFCILDSVLEEVKRACFSSPAAMAGRISFLLRPTASPISSLSRSIPIQTEVSKTRRSTSHALSEKAHPKAPLGAPSALGHELDLDRASALCTRLHRMSHRLEHLCISQSAPSRLPPITLSSGSLLSRFP